MHDLGDIDFDVPEIYWIKGHSGIHWNEMADKLAKRARHRAEMDQPELIRRPDRSAPFLNIHGLNPFFME